MQPRINLLRQMYRIPSKITPTGCSTFVCVARFGRMAHKQQHCTAVSDECADIDRHRAGSEAVDQAAGDRPENSCGLEKRRTPRYGVGEVLRRYQLWKKGLTRRSLKRSYDAVGKQHRVDRPR